MLGIKKIDIFILRKFFQMFLGCFLICLFVFMMQFVWKHIETMVGKGLGLDILAQFFFYMGVTLVPMALPMSVLLTSLLTFGNMGEQLELTAMKAAGIPLLRIMRPIIISAVILTGVSFYFQNNISPKAQMEMARMLFSMKSTSPALEIPEGIFYNGIPNVNLYVERKDAATGMLYDVIIYKIDNGIENAQIVVADSAKLETTADKHYLKLSMYSGEQFENLQTSSSSDAMMSRNQVPYDRETFQNKVLLIEFNTDFDLMNAEDLKNLADAKSLHQLTVDADSMTMLYDSLGRANYQELTARYMQTGYSSPHDSAIATRMGSTIDIDTLFDGLSQAKRLSALRDASSAASGMLTELDWRTPVSQDGYRMIRRHNIKWHDMFASSLACLFFFFIGAPLGAIIRKGGLGVSTIVSVLIFIIYYIVGVSGMKMARDGTWNVTYGMWISTFVMAPLGIFLTYKSNKDATVFNLDNYKEAFLSFLGIRPKRHLQAKEVIIETPDYVGDITALRQITTSLDNLSIGLRLNRLPNYVTMFFAPRPLNPLPDIAQRLEHVITDLSNSDDRRIVYQLNSFPIIYTQSHLTPTGNKWVNMLLGIVVPAGALVWYRSLYFRRRLNRDIKQTETTSREIISRLEARLADNTDTINETTQK